MSVTTEAFIREAKSRAMDTIAVHNPTTEDYTFWNDKFGPTPQKLIVPANTRDIGHGKGNAHLPRYLAARYSRSMIEQIITKIADDDWESKKKKYHTRDEMLQHADRVTIRTNDAKLWKELTPKIWLGLVERFGGEDIPDPVEALIPDSGDPMADTMKELGLEDRVYEPTSETI